VLLALDTPVFVVHKVADCSRPNIGLVVEVFLDVSRTKELLANQNWVREIQLDFVR
jgi:hypothetical protein